MRGTFWESFGRRLNSYPQFFLTIADLRVACLRLLKG